LIGATEMNVDEVVEEIHRLEGLAVAAHIDRESYSVISQLGFIPEGLRFDALELSQTPVAEDALRLFPTPAESAFIRNSDAHFLEDIGKRTTDYTLETPTFQELRSAFHNEGGRHVEIA